MRRDGQTPSQPEEPRLTAAPESTDAPSGWRRASEAPPLAEVFRSVRVTGRGRLARLLAFLGPGYIVAVGYMDPGNWATSLAGGSRYGYALLFVALLSNLMAIVLQSLCGRLSIATGRDLAQACRDAFPRWATVALWLLAELAIVATDIAEVIGTAIGLKLLFHIPLAAGVIVTTLDVFLILLLQRLGFRWIEAVVVALLGVIAACFAVQVALARPDWAAAVKGFLPTPGLVTDPQELFLALGIIGATVMPHNLYLHSAIVGTRDYAPTDAGRREALVFSTIDTTVALCLALFVNAAILVLAAATFHASGHTDVEDLTQAHTLLSPLLGAGLAPALFAVALLCCGLSSTVTATLAGQAVMEGFIQMRLAPWLRRLLTRLLAVGPAAAVTILYGEGETARLLIASQVVLSFQLPFAVIPLVWFTATRRKMGTLASPIWLTATAAVIAAVIVALNIKLIADAVLS